MPGYQFYKRTIEAQSETRYLCTDQDQFLAHREQLLAQGFEVIGYLIYAPNETEAIARFNQEMINPLLDCTETPAPNNAYYFVEAAVKSICNRLKKFKTL
jgi:thiazole synthase ThiGH ThiG subunit